MPLVFCFRNALVVTAASMFALGLIDFGLQYYRVELMLRTTVDEHREDQKAIDTDPRSASRA